MNEKILLLMRHGEALEPIASQKDISRELTPKGQADAYKAGQFLVSSGLTPELIVCSAATRALQTAELLSSQIQYPKENIQSDEALYQASLGVWINRIHELPNSTDTVLFVAHNPTLTYLAEYLTGETYSLQPASCLCIKFLTTNWNLISKGQGLMGWFKQTW